MRLAIKLCVIMLIVGTSLDAANGQNSLPAGSRVVIAPMGGFETYFAAAVRKKNVPITLTLDKNSAQYFVVSTDTEWQGFVYGSGTSAGWNRSGGSIVSGSSGRSTRGLEASIMLIDSKTKMLCGPMKCTRAVMATCYWARSPPGESSLSQKLAPSISRNLSRSRDQVLRRPRAPRPKAPWNLAKN
jgi:hypothetical protein